MQVEGLNASVVDYINEIENKNQELKDTIKTLTSNYEQRIKELHFKYLTTKEKLEILLYHRFMRSAEKIPADDKQQLLFTAEAAETTAADEQEETIEVKSHQRKKSGRKPLDPKLPRVEKIIDISDDEKTCACGAKLTKIGEETSEKLHIIPQRIYVEKTIRPKYACRCCEGTADEDTPAVKIAPVEPSIIPRGIASPTYPEASQAQAF